MSPSHVCSLFVTLINTDGHLLSYPLTNGGITVTEIVLKEPAINLRPKKWLPDGESANDIIAVLYCSPSNQLYLEPRVEGCSLASPSSIVQAPILPNELDDLVLPASNEHQGFVLACLRVGDTVIFKYHHFRLVVCLQDMPYGYDAFMRQPAAPADATNAESGADEDTIKVRHRLTATPKPGPLAVDEGAETESEDETGVEEDHDASPQNAPTTGPTTVGTVAESPNRLPSSAGSSGVAASTAPVLDPNSPLHQKTKDSQGETQAQADALLRKAAEHSDVLGQDEMMMPVKKPPRLTYGAQGVHAHSRGTPSSSRATPKYIKTEPLATSMRNEDGDDEENIVVARTTAAAEGDELTFEEATELMLAYDNTSEPRDEHGSVIEAARRTMPVSKRKSLEMVDDEEADTVPVPPKRSRKQLPRAAEPDEKASPRRTRTLGQATTPRSGPQTSSKRAKAAASGDVITVVPHASTAEPSYKPSTAKGSEVKTRSVSSTPYHNLRATPALTAPPKITAADSGKPPKVLLSGTVKTNRAVTAYLSSQKITVLDKLPAKRTDFICVVDLQGPMVATAKVLRSLARGVLVVTDSWVTDSALRRELLDPRDYVHADLIASQDVDRSTLFSGQRLFFTRQLVKDYGVAGWANVKELVREAGAKSVDKGSAAAGFSLAHAAEVLFFGSGAQDPDVVALWAGKAGVTVFGKEMLARSLLRGRLARENGEFELEAPATAVGAMGKNWKGKKGRKS